MHLNTITKMAKKEKKQHLTRDERIAKEYPDGFVIKRYSRLVQVVVFLTMLLLSLTLTILILRRWELHNKIVGLLVYLPIMLFGFFLIDKIIAATGTTVNLKITNEGLEQTKISKSVLVPEKRIVEWENMKFYRRWLGILTIRTKKGKNYRLETWPVMSFRCDDLNVFDDFEWEFERWAKQQKIQFKSIL